MDAKELDRSTGGPGPYRFDGHGINAGDKYATRLLTFAKMHKDDGGGYVLDSDGRRAVGELMAAAPELAAALRALLDAFDACTMAGREGVSPAQAIKQRDAARALLGRLNGPRPVDVD